MNPPAASAPSAVSPWAALAADGSPARAALIGVSGYGRIHLHLLRELQARGAVRLTAAVIINPDEEAQAVAELRAGGCRIHADYRTMLAAEAGRLDLCCIPTGIPWHAPMTIAALQAGAHVLVEKPLAGSLAEVDAIRAAERATGRWVAVGFQDIYQPQIAWLKQQLLAPAIGPLRSLRFVGMWPRSQGYFSRNDWAGRLTAEGRMVLDSPLNNAFAHFVNLALFLTGDAPARSAGVRELQAELFRARAIESCDIAVVRAVSDTGARLFVGATHACCVTHEPEIVIEGERGRAVWSHERFCRIEPADGAPGERPLPDAMDARRHMLAAVLRRLRDPAVMICDTAMAERHAAFIAVMHAATAIRTVAPAMIDWTVLPGDPAPVPCVRGLEKNLMAAFERGCLLGETGLLAGDFLQPA